MSFRAFFKENVKTKANEKVVISDRFTDESGNSLPFEIKALTSEIDNALRDEATTITPTGQTKFDINKYTTMLVAASVVCPDLGNAELQDSYGVKTKTALLSVMLLPGELQELSLKVQKINGFKSLDEMVTEVKN